MDETQSVTYRKPLLLTLIFLAGFALCLLICNLSSPELFQFTTTDLSQLYLFLYANLPSAIVKLLLLANSSPLGIVYSLVACCFFLVIGILLYCCPTDEKFSDEAEANQADSPLRRLLHYFCCFPFLQMVCLATGHIAFGLKYVQEPKLYCFVAPCMFLLFTIIEFFTAKTKTQKWKSICRLLGSVSITLGIAGLAGRIGDHEQMGLVLPIPIRQLLIQIAGNIGTGFGGTLVMILIMVGCGIALVACITTAIRAAEDFMISFSSISVHLLILFTLSFFSPYFRAAWAETIFDADHFSYWLLMLVAMTVLAIFCSRNDRRNGIKFWLSSIGAFTFLAATLDSIRAFSGNLSYNLSRLTLWGSTIELRILEVIMRHCPEGHWTYVVFLISILVIVVGLFILLYRPLIKIREENADKVSAYEYQFLASPKKPGVFSILFLLGFGLCCLGHTLFNLPWTELAGYYLCALSTIAFCMGLIGSIILRYRVTTGYYLFALGVTAFWTLMMTFFGNLIVIVVGCVAFCIAIYSFILAGISTVGQRTKSNIRCERMGNIAEGYALLEEIDQLERSGQISSVEARYRAMEVRRTMKLKNEALDEELEAMEESS